MKLFCHLGLVVTILLTGFGAGTAFAQTTVTKATSSATLSSGTSWTGGNAPNSGSIASWDSTSGSGTWSLGENVNWGKISFSNVTGDGTINGNNTLTLSAISGVGIDMSSASANLTITGGTVTLGNSQTFTVGSGRTLTVGSKITGTGKDLTKAGSGTLTLGTTSTTETYSGATVVSGGILVLNGNIDASSSVTVGSGATLRYGAIDRIGMTAPVTLNGGTLDLQTYRDHFGTLTLNNGGQVVAAGISDDYHLYIAGATGQINATGTGNAIGSDIVICSQWGGNAGNRTQSIDVASGGTLEITGRLRNYPSYSAAYVGSVTKTGDGTLKLSGANTYTGVTRINDGTLVMGSSTALGTISASGGTGSVTFGGSTGVLVVSATGTIGALSSSVGGTITSTGAFTLTSSGTGTANTSFNGVLQDGSGTLSFVKTGTGSLTLSGANTYTGGTTINGGTLTIGGSGSLNSSGTILIASGAMFNYASSASQTLSGAISGQGAVVKSGNNSTLTLSGANTYSGGTTISGGTLSISGSGSIGSGALTFYNGAFQIAANNLTFGNTVTITASTTGTIDVTSGNSGTLGGVIGNTSGALVKTGSGQLTLSNVNTYTGGTTVTGGTLSIAAGGALSGSGNINTTGGGVLSISGAVTTASGSYFAVGTSAPLSTTTGTTIVNSGGVLNVGNGGGAVVIGGATNTSTTGGSGTLTINAGGVVNVGAAGSGGTPDATKLWLNPHLNGYPAVTSTINLNGLLSSARDIYVGSYTTAKMVIDGGTLQAAANFSLGANASAYPLNIYINSGGAVFDTGTYTLTQTANAPLVQGAGSGGVTKVGNGNLILNGANTFSGGATISAGTLVINHAGALNATTPNAVTVNTGTLDLNGYGITVGALSGSGGTITDNSSGAGTTTLTINQSATTTLSSILQNGSAKTLALTKSGAGMLTLSGNNTYTGTTTLTDGIVQVGVSSGTGTGAFGNGGYVNFYGGKLTSDSNDAREISNPFTITAASTTLGDATNTGKLILTGNGTLTAAGHTVTLNSDVEISGIISGTGSLTKAGAGALVLSGSNGYSGGTTINEGTITMGHASGLGNSSGTLTFTGAATLNLGTFSPTVGALSSSSGYGTITASGGAAVTFTVSQTANTTFSGVIQNGGGTVSFVKSGNGALTLNGANTFTGGATISAGTIAVGDNNALSTGTLTFSGAGTLQAAANNKTLGNTTITLNARATVDTVGNTFSITGAIGGSGSLTKTGAGILVLSGNNSFGNLQVNGTGGLNITAGQTTVSATVGATVFGTNSSDNVAVNINGGALVIQQAGGGAGNYAWTTIGDSGKATVTISGGGVFTNTVYYGQVLARTGAASAGTLTISSGVFYQAGTAANSGLNLSYGGTGIVNLDGGRLVVDQVYATAGTSTFNFNGGTLSPVGSGKASYDSSFMTRLTTANILGGGANIDVGSGVSITIGQALQGIGALNKYGAGTLTLSGVNTFTGDTVINSGRLVVGSTTALQGSTVNYNNQGGTLSFGSQTAATFGGLKGAQNLTLANASSTAVTLTVGNNNQDATYSGILSGAGAIIKTGTGTWSLSNGNSYSGGTRINNGWLRMENASALGISTGTLTMGGGTLQVNGYTLNVGNVTGSGVIENAKASSTGTVTINQTTDTTLSATLQNGSGSGSVLALIKNGSGALTISGVNTYNGSTTVNAGTLIVASSSALGTSTVNLGTTSASATDAAILVASGYTLNRSITVRTGSTGTLTVGGSSTGSGTISGAITANNNLYLTQVSGGTITFTGTINGSSYQLTKSGDGTAIIANSTTFTGGTTVNAGTLQLAGSGSRLSDSGGVTISGGAFNLGNTTETVGSVTVNSGYIVNGTLTGGAFTKTTSGTGTLTARGTFSSASITDGTLYIANTSGTGLTSSSGTVTVNGGTLRVNNSSSSYGVGSAVNVTSGTLAGSGTINGAVTIQSGGHLAPGNSIESLASTSLTLNGGSVLDWEFLTDINGVYQGQLDQYLTGTLTLNTPSSKIGVNIRQYSPDGLGGFNPNNSFRFDDTNQLQDPPYPPVDSQSYKLIRFAVAVPDLSAIANSFTVSNASTTRNYMFRSIADGGYNWVVLDMSQVAGFWTGGANNGGLWSTAGNWSGTVPAEPDAWVYFQNNTYSTVDAEGVNRTYDRVIFRDTGGANYTINNGTLTLATMIQNASAPTATINTHLVMNAGTGQFQVDTLAGNVVINGDISGSGTLTKLGTKTLELTGNNSYAGATDIQSGILRVSNLAQALSPNSNLKFSGGILESSGTFTRSLGGGGGSVQWTGSGGFSARDGTLTVNIAGAVNPQTVTWGTGSFTPNSGTLKFSSSSANSTVRFLNPIDLAGGTRIFEVANGTAAVDAELAGALSNGSVTKTGTGTMLLSANSSYSGATTVSAGVLLVGGTLAGSSVFVNGGATLGGTGTLAGATTISTGATLAPGDGVGSVGVLTVNNLTLAENFTYKWDLGASVTDRVDVAALTFAGGAWTLSLGIENGLRDSHPELWGEQGIGAEYVLFHGVGSELSALANSTDGIDLLGPAIINVAGNGYWSTENARVFVRGNDLILTGVYLIPEPSVLVLWLSGLATVYAARRRRHRKS